MSPGAVFEGVKVSRVHCCFLVSVPCVQVAFFFRRITHLYDVSTAVFFFEQGAFSDTFSGSPHFLTLSRQSTFFDAFLRPNAALPELL